MELVFQPMKEEQLLLVVVCVVMLLIGLSGAFYFFYKWSVFTHNPITNAYQDFTSVHVVCNIIHKVDSIFFIFYSQVQEKQMPTAKEETGIHGSGKGLACVCVCVCVHACVRARVCALHMFERECNVFNKTILLSAHLYN